MKKITGYIRKYFYILFLIALLGCRGGVGSPGYVQPQYSYNTYYGGYGTDYYSGAVVVVVSPASGYESFQISIQGAGTYNLPYGTNQIQFNYLLPGSYGFSISSSTGYYLNGYVTVYSTTTTQLNIYPSY